MPIESTRIDKSILLIVTYKKARMNHSNPNVQKRRLNTFWNSLSLDILFSYPPGCMDVEVQ